MQHLVMKPARGLTGLSASQQHMLATKTLYRYTENSSTRTRCCCSYFLDGRILVARCGIGTKCGLNETQCHACVYEKSLILLIDHVTKTCVPSPINRVEKALPFGFSLIPTGSNDLQSE